MSVIKNPTGSTCIDCELTYTNTPYDVFLCFLVSLMVLKFILSID